MSIPGKNVSPHILIVDDDELALNLVKLATERAGYRASVASSATEALEQFRKGKFDVVVADIKMPDMTGLELLKLIKEHDESTPVILLTASDQRDDAVKAIKLGAQDYLLKPSSAREIQDSIAQVLIEQDKLNKLQRKVTVTINIQSFPRLSFTKLLKRLVDIFLSLLGLILLSPVVGLIFLAVRLCMGSPGLFRQQRPGRNGKPFTMYKFRTMTNAPPGIDVNITKDEKRIVPLGKFLRATSLDELPELFNVLKGDMSLVGPRPLLMNYLERYSPYDARRHEVRPGITGWAQVNGRNDLTWEAKFALDIWYIDNMSLWLDIRILFLTIWGVIRREGIGHQEQVIMPEYFRPPDEELDWKLRLDE